MNTSKTPAIVADLGGTSLRIGQAEQLALHDVETLRCDDFSGPAEALGHYLDKHRLQDAVLCLAVASPVTGDRIDMTNRNWHFSQRELQAQLTLTALHVINDFQAVAMALPFIPDDQLVQIGGQSPQQDAPKAVCGPGTGLGVAHAVKVAGHWQPLTGEGGHVDFAPGDLLEQQLLHILAQRFGHVSAERLLSGPGLENIHQALCQIQDGPEETLSAAEITEAACRGRSPLCTQALQAFCAILGGFAGNLALGIGAFGGVYIAGGMVPRFVDFLEASPFRRRFEAKGRYQDYNARIPAFVITASQPGLLGAAAWLHQQQAIEDRAKGIDA